MTSDELLEGADTPYQSIVIIGGGVIGVEFAAFFSQLGCRVTLVEGMANLLPQLDRELGQNLAQILKKQGVEVAGPPPWCSPSEQTAGGRVRPAGAEGKGAGRHRRKGAVRHWPPGVFRRPVRR